MKHIHLDLHVNTHVVHSIIVSSLAVISIAALEYINLNSAMAYEKETVIELFELSQ